MLAKYSTNKPFTASLDRAIFLADNIEATAENAFTLMLPAKISRPR
jgi:hypothetical protein